MCMYTLILQFKGQTMSSLHIQLYTLNCDSKECDHDKNQWERVNELKLCESAFLVLFMVKNNLKVKPTALKTLNQSDNKCKNKNHLEHYILRQTK
jgi:uncharacterized protein YgiM (DUF1202 family)